MSVAIRDASARTTRLAALVSAPEAAEIARRAEEAGVSVSAYLRDQALGRGVPADADALHAIDTLIDRMTGAVDSAIAAMAATLSRLDCA